jgi:hypothetical protein
MNGSESRNGFDVMLPLNSAEAGQTHDSYSLSLSHLNWYKRVPAFQLSVALTLLLGLISGVLQAKLS